jgi:Putative outer membrane beta-barrel porin, MtrB/PioB
MVQRTEKTIMPWNRNLWVYSALLLSLLLAGPVRAEVAVPDSTESETDSQEPTVETSRYASVQSGYRFITPDGPPAAASPYGRLKSGVIGGGTAGTLGPDLKLTIDGSFLHEDDYHAELFFDYGGLVRFHAESVTLWHNLLHEQVNPGNLALITRDQDLAYGTRTSINQAETRIKLGNNPFHLNLGYWELRRDGFEQLRFSDHFFDTAASSVITSSNRVDHSTREGKFGLDAHLGLFDLSYGFRIRDFSNEAADPRFTYTNDASGALIPGSHAHDVIPDNQVTSHTIKLFSDLSGGLVGSASYNMTQRENRGGHGETVPAERPSDIIHSVAGDLTYTPSKRHSFAIKYRHREIDRSTPASLFYPYSQIPDSPPGVYTTVPGQLLVRPATSSVKDTLTVSATFRPAPKVIYRLEYNAELEARDKILDPQAPAGSPTALHSDRRQTHTGTATFYWRPVNGLKLNTSYSYAASDNPAYGASFSDRHIGKLLVTYATSGRWGVTGSYLARYESGKRNAFTASPAPVASFSLPRESRSGSANTSVWFSPLKRLTVTANYSFLETETDQSILFASLIADPAPLVVSNYRSTSHVYGIDAVYAVAEPLDISLAFQQVRSQARFSVPDRSFTLAGVNGVFTTAGITDLTRLDTTETGISARADWRITALLGCSLDYNFRMFESGQPIYDGSVHSTMVTLKARW